MGGVTTLKSSMFSNLNPIIFRKKFSTSISLKADINKASPPFQSLEYSLARFPNLIKEFSSLNKEYHYIIHNNGGITIELLENSYKLGEVRSGLLSVRNKIRLELELANVLFENIKLTHPNFISNKLLEYNNFYISNKL